MARVTSAAPLSTIRNTTSRKPKSPATISDVGMTWLPLLARLAAKIGEEYDRRAESSMSHVLFADSRIVMPETLILLPSCGGGRAFGEEFHREKIDSRRQRGQKQKPVRPAEKRRDDHEMDEIAARSGVEQARQRALARRRDRGEQRTAAAHQPPIDEAGGPQRMSRGASNRFGTPRPPKGGSSRAGLIPRGRPKARRELAMTIRPNALCSGSRARTAKCRRAAGPCG